MSFSLADHAVCQAALELDGGVLSPEAAEILRTYATVGVCEQFAEAFFKAYVKGSSMLLKKAARRFIGPHTTDLELAHLASEEILRRRLPVSVESIYLESILK